ncbi:hypothetical protein BH23CHL8_BH23CHL8_27500 [soil metagenome]
MRKVIRHARSKDPDTARWLRVIDVFDGLMAERAPLDRLARSAARITRRQVGIDDAWNGRRVVVGVADAEGDGPVGHRRRAARDSRGAAPDAEAVAGAVNRNVVERRLRGRRSGVLVTPAGEVVAATVEVGSGRIGVVWLAGGRGDWTPLDHLVAERLAAAIAMDALQHRTTEEARSRIDPAAVERMLSGSTSDEETASLARQSQLRPDRRYAAIAVRERPMAAASPEAIAQVAAQAIVRHGLVARPVVMGRRAVIVAETGPRLDEALHHLAAGEADRGFGLELGVGDPVELGLLPRSWQQAREALALHSLVASSPSAVHFRDLGLLHLLVQIPGDAVEGFDDFRRLIALDVRRGSASDLDLLEAYLDGGSLRRAAARVFLHHTTVDYRLRRIERDLGISLEDPADRLRTHLTVKLVRVQRALDT